MCPQLTSIAVVVAFLKQRTLSEHPRMSRLCIVTQLLLLLHVHAHKFSSVSFPVVSEHTTSSLALPIAAEGPVGAPVCGTAHRASSVLSGVKMIKSTVMELPYHVKFNGYEPDWLCCSSAAGYWYTMAFLGPASRKGIYQYACTTWSPLDPSVDPQFKPANSSVTAGCGGAKASASPSVRRRRRAQERIHPLRRHAE